MPAIVRRDNAEVHLQFPPLTKEELKASIAFDPEMVVDGTEPGYPASRLDLQPGDQIISANGEEVKNPASSRRSYSSPRGRPLPSSGAATERN